MSLDDRIQQLSDTIIQEVRGPIDQALRRLLAEMMTVAAEERDRAVTARAEELTRGHEAAMADLSDRHAADLAAATERHAAAQTELQDVRAQHLTVSAALAALQDQHRAATAALGALEEQHQAAVTALRQESDAQRDQALQAHTERLTGEHAARVSALLDEHQSALAALRQEHEATLASIRDEHQSAAANLAARGRAERDEALRAQAEQSAREHEAAISALREQHEAEREAATSAFRQQHDAEREAAVRDAREALIQAHATTLQETQEQFRLERETAVTAARAEVTRLEEELRRFQDRAEAERDAAVQQALEKLRLEHAAELEEAGRRSTLASAFGVAGGAALGAGADHAALSAALNRAEQGRQDAEARAAELGSALACARADLDRADQARRDEQTAGQARQAEALATERQAELACSERIVEALRAMDRAASLSEVLAVLVEKTAAEVGRAAIFLVQGQQVRGWRVAGFKPENLDPRDLETEITHADVLGRAVSSGLPVSRSEASWPAALERSNGHGVTFALPADCAGLAVPLVVGGRAAAVLYADDASEQAPGVPSNWPEIAEILARHAAHCLEVLTLSRASALAGRVQQQPRPPAVRPLDSSPFADDRREEESARRYARLLISEIKLYNETAVEQGRRDRNLLARLGPEIERARRLYEEKIPAAVRLRVDCFEQELLSTLAGGDPGLLG